MTTTTPHSVTEPAPVEAHRIPRRMSRREARAAAARLTTDAAGQPAVVRFSLAQRVEHQLLIVSFTVLTVTGLAQRFADVAIGDFALMLMGGIETTRQVHRLFAAIFVLETIYHLAAFVYNYVMYDRKGSLWPNRDDARHIVQMLRFNLGRIKQRPHFGRYTFEEKVEYWALVWGTGVMILTGFMQAFPILVTRFLPGDAIPIARAVHGWEAILAAASILLWHMYHTVVKERNTSIFTGLMSEAAMHEEHPAELAYLKAAAAALENEAAAVAAPTDRPAAAPEEPTLAEALRVLTPANEPTAGGHLTLSSPVAAEVNDDSDPV